MKYFDCKTRFIQQKFFLTISAIVLFASLPALISAASGDLDPSFGNGGIAITPITNSYWDAPRSLLVQPDGKILVCGQSLTVIGEDFYLASFFLARYNANGTLDASFGTNGKIITPGSLEGDYGGADIALQPDGKIVTVGLSNDRKFLVYRYHPNGTLDASFGSGGKVTTPIGILYSVASKVAVQPDGKIVVAGYSNTGTSGDTDFAIVRYNADGSLDTSFGAGGKVITGIALYDSITEILLQPDGKIVAVGTIYPPSQSDFALVRYNPNGSLDSSFGANGIFIHQITSWYDYAYDAALQPDGKIVVVGTIVSENKTAIVRYNQNGSVDTSFAANGIFSTPRDFFGVFLSEVAGIAVQPNGKIVSFGISGSNLAVIRLNPNGTTDASFGTNGRVVTPIAGRGSAGVKGVIQPDGKIVALGEDFIIGGNCCGPNNIIVTRYLGDSAEPRPTQFDFDGDAKADISVFRPSDGVWYLNRSTQGFSATHFGLSSDRLAPADYDGDGRTDIAVFRDGTWYLFNSTAGFAALQFGSAGDVPQPADFDGDGRAELAVYRAGTWFTFNLANNQFNARQFGIATDKPVASDYDGDGRADYAVFRDSTWYLLQSTQGFSAIQFGISTDRLIPADYDGDGKTDLAVYREGIWYQLNSQSGFTAFQFGNASDIPVPADYDGDARADTAVFREGVWYLRQSANGFAAVPFGLANDKPVPAAFLQ